MTGDAGDEVARHPGLPHDDREQRAVDPLQMPDELGLDLVTGSTHRPASEQRLGAGAQDGLEKSIAASRPSTTSRRSPKPMREAAARRTPEATSSAPPTCNKARWPMWLRAAVEDADGIALGDHIPKTLRALFQSMRKMSAARRCSPGNRAGIRARSSRSVR
jgi:hypothetical protein